jgi:hypothetical protein
VFVSVPFQPMATPVWTAPYASLPLNSGSGGDGRVEGAIATLLARVGARRAWSPDRSQRARRHVESEHLDVGGDVVAHDVVGAAQPEAGALAARVVGGAAVAAARREVAGALRAHHEVVLEDVHRLAAVLGHDAGTAAS